VTLVELDLFSGRENPRWRLEQQEEAEFAQLVELLQPTLGEIPEPPALGYRGFVVSAPAGVYRAYGGSVETPTGLRRDSRKAAERFLLSTLPPELGDLRRIVDEEIQRP
jgi:hypothetical protein